MGRKREREREKAGDGSSGTAAHRVVHRWREGASASPERESERARVLRVRGVVAGVSKFWYKNKTVEGEAADSVFDVVPEANNV